AVYFGGGAGYNNGLWTAPEFQITQFKADGTVDKKQSYDNVADAFKGINDNMTNMNDRINEVEEKVNSGTPNGDGLNWNSSEGAYDARHDGEESKITHVADGKIESGSKDVVNGGQLWETNERVTDVENKIKDLELSSPDGAVSYDKDANGDKTNTITLKGGSESDPVLIENVADGKIEEGSKQAINGGQLHAYTKEQMDIVLDDAKKYTDNAIEGVLDNAKFYTDLKFEALNYAVEDVRKEARQAAAIGLAVANLSYDDTPGKLSLSFGSGLWRSQSAFAIGAGYRSEDGNIFSNISATSAGGHFGIGAGFRITLN
ncbi:autotransporter adhesin, partial [Bartonella japonica]